MEPLRVTLQVRFEVLRQPGQPIEHRLRFPRAFRMPRIHHHVEQAIEQLSVLEDSRYRQAMIELANFAVGRDH